MKRILLALMLLTPLSQTKGQSITTASPLFDSAFALAVWTIDHNTHNGILEAGAGYGGEWTRDASINAYNAASLLRPEVAERTLWSVTEDSVRIGHQYWDKILWVTAAWHHYQVTGNERFLEKAYACSRLTMEELEQQCFDRGLGLFMGPAVFQDGIEAYPEPIYDPKKWDDSFVLRHHHSDSIRCLSTNIAYLQAYRSLAMMACTIGQSGKDYTTKAEALQKSILRHFYDKKNHHFIYLIDHQGVGHDYQEGMGIGMALMSHILSRKEAQKMVDRLDYTTYGLPSVSPSFPRNSKERPGRHNMMIWPHINAAFAKGCADNGMKDRFYQELINMTQLAMINGQGNFYEIYTIEGTPSGGWQCGSLWDKKEHQTWCATGYLSLWICHVFGLKVDRDGTLSIAPMGLGEKDEITLQGIEYRGTRLSITVRGSGPHIEATLNGKHTKDLTVKPGNGELHYDITLS